MIALEAVEATHVRFESEADMCTATTLSALHPIATAKADMPQW
jgi:hypothetical protein